MPISDTPPSFTAQDALVAAMVGLSASDENITTKELLSISRMVDTLPIFDGYDHDRLRTIGQTVFDLFTEEDGLDALFGLMRDALPDRCARRPTRSAATSRRLTAMPSRPSCSSCSSCATSSRSTACTPPQSSAGARRGTGFRRRRDDEGGRDERPRYQGLTVISCVWESYGIRMAFIWHLKKSGLNR